MTIPGSLRESGWPGYVGSVSFYRRFGRPSNLGTGDRVRLAFSGVIGAAEVRLNREHLGQLTDKGVFDIADRLRDRNELELRMVARSDASGIVGDVSIEIWEGT
jgi:hypothetical protein